VNIVVAKANTSDTEEVVALGRTVKIVLSSISVIGAIIGAFLTVDSRYVLAADFESYQKQTQQIIQKQTQELQNQGILLRKQLVDDKLFELDAKRGQGGALSPIEDAQYRRYQRQQQELETALPRSNQQPQ
jgi:hypothetical protein